VKPFNKWRKAMTIRDDDIEPGLVVLGASKFSSPDLYSNPSFKRSKSAFIAEAIANGIPAKRVLDLFDSDLSVGTLFDKIAYFLRHNPAITDLIIYYCGHGGLTNRDEFYLALKAMRRGREASEGLNLGQLRTDLDDWLSPRRVYLVLDCCFAAAALMQSQFMSVGNVTPVVADQVFETFPKAGTALLAAAPASAPAKAFEGEEYTVFTGALVQALHEGIDGLGARLSLRDIFDRAEVIIKDERAGTAPVPELYPRAQNHSDIAGTPIFFNAARSKPLSGETPYGEGFIRRKPLVAPEGAASSLAERIEQIARRRGPLVLGLQALVAAFLMSLVSTFCHLGWLETNDGRQVGFLFAPNWTIVYLVLFPPYLAIFAVLAGRCHTTLIDFSDERIVTDSRGSPVSHAAILAAWSKALKDHSIIMWVFLVVVVIQTVGEWINSCFLPLLHNKIGDVAIDWSTLAIVEPLKADRWITMFFTAFAYTYMGIALFIYLAILIYAATFAVFLNQLSDPSGQFRLVFRSPILWQRFSGIVVSVYACVILGIGAAIAMRTQAEYLQSKYTLITGLWFSDVASAFHWLRGDAETAGSSRAFHIPSEWTSFAELFFTLFMLFIVVYLVYCAFDKARGYYLEHIHSAGWQDSMDIQFSREEVEEVRSRTFLNSVVPHHFDMGVVLTGEVLSYAFIGVGSIGIVTLMYALLRIVVVLTRTGPSRIAAGKADRTI
jgi:hypothetical protein